MLKQPVTVLTGVGPKRAQELKKNWAWPPWKTCCSAFPEVIRTSKRYSAPPRGKPGRRTACFRPPLFYLQERPIPQGRRIIQGSLGGILTLTWFVHHRGRGGQLLIPPAAAG